MNVILSAFAAMIKVTTRPHGQKKALWTFYKVVHVDVAVKAYQSTFCH